MSFNYEDVEGVGLEEFEKHKPSDQDLSDNYNKADDSEIRKMERLLDVEEGSLSAGGPYYLRSGNCSRCNKTLTMYDFVLLIVS